MNKTRLLWILVAANVLLAFASVGAEGFLGWTLPSALANYQHNWFSGFGFSNLIHFALLAMTTLCAFAAWIGLVSFWSFARKLYLVSIAFDILLTLYSGPSVQTSVGAMFQVMGGVVGGVILGLVYFSDLARRYERPPVETPAPTGMNVRADHA
jgi:hypothetical protein